MSKLQFTPRVWAAAGAVAAASVASPAQAVILSYNTGLSSGTVFSDAEIGGASSGNVIAPQVFINVTQFDSSLGTLQSIELGWSENFLSFSEGLAIANLASCFEAADCSYQFSVGFDVFGTLTIPGGSTTSLAQAHGSGNGSADGGGGTTANFNYSLGTQSLTSSPIDIGSSPFASFIGNSTWQAAFDLDVRAISFVSGCQDGELGSCGSLIGPGGEFWPNERVLWVVDGLQVTYTYETDAVDVPEPGTLVPFSIGIGLLGLASVLRSRKRRAGDDHSEDAGVSTR